MDRQAALRQFLATATELIRTRFTGYNILGNFPNGRNAHKELAYQLQQDIFAFAERYKGEPPGSEAVWVAAQRVEGGIMTAQAVGALTETEAKAAIDNLYDLVERN